MPDNNTDWGLKKKYLHSTRQSLWNNDYLEFLVKCVWKIETPVFMEKLGLKNVGVRINDYVDFVSAGTDAFESEQRRFMIDHGVDEKYADSNGYLAARCHVISFGYK